MKRQVQSAYAWPTSRGFLHASPSTSVFSFNQESDVASFEQKRVLCTLHNANVPVEFQSLELRQ